MTKETGKPTKKRKKPAIMDAALRYLGYRMRSEEEMRRYLQRREYEETEIEETIEKLKEYNYIDDRQFAQELIRQKRAQRPVGKRRLQQDLIKAGIARHMIEEGLEQYSYDEELETCSEYAKSLIQRYGSCEKEILRIQRRLLSRGFSYDQVYQSIEQYREETEGYFA